MSTTTVRSELDVRSVIDLTQRLVRVPSPGGAAGGPIATELVGWLASRNLAHTVLTWPTATVAGVTATVRGVRPGPHIVLDACLDTAPVGDLMKWSRSPFSGDLAAGWLHGRGAADSKVAVAMFAHLIADLHDAQARGEIQLAGQLTLLADLDEHTGGFGGVRAFLAQQDDVGRAPDGVLIGYPGVEKVVTGGRGFWRARVIVHGESAHTGRREAAGINAVTRAAYFMCDVAGRAAQMRTLVEPGFGIAPTMTVTSVRAGSAGAFSVVPDVAVVELDARLTPTWDAQRAARMVDRMVTDLDEHPLAGGVRATEVEQVGESWPPYQLAEDHTLVRALVDGARQVGLSPHTRVAGPSNIGCLLAERGIPATAGFGVHHVGLHGTDEAIDVTTIAPVYATYRNAVLTLLG